MHQAPADNQNLRELFTLPPIKPCSSTDVAKIELPPKKALTGDVEVDAVLWLRSVVSTGQAALIDKATLPSLITCRQPIAWTNPTHR